MQAPSSSHAAEVRGQDRPEASPPPEQSQDLAQQYLDIAGVILVALDANGDITLLNRKGYEVLEHPEGSLIGKNWFQTCLPERVRAEVASIFRRLMAEDVQPVERVENAVLTRLGRERIIAWHNALLRDKNGKCVGTLSSGEDITDRKLVEEALRDSEERYRRLFETESDAILLVDCSTGRILDANAAALKLYGYSREELLLLHAVDVSAEPDKTRLAIATCQTRIPLRWHRKKDGTVFPVEIAGSYFDVRGQGLHVAAIRDITERKRVEEELRETQRQAVAANRAKSEFLANMSHEIRTPMTAILGFADLLLNPNLSRQEQRGFLETIARNGRLLLELVDDILDLSKIEAEKMSVESVDCSLRQIVDDVLGVVRVRARDKGLDLEVGYDSSAPETIHTDPTRLRQILVNLVDNAIKFTERGGVQIAVRGGESQQGRAQVRFAISDTGIGISPDELGRLFQPFTQGDASTTRRFGGTGLGLAISKRLANLLGGDIAVRSESGRGSTFTLTVDAGPAKQGRPPPAMPDVSAAEQKPRSGEPERAIQGRVLVAEDVADLQGLLRRIFRGMSLEIEVAKDGRSACEEAVRSNAEGKPFDLILMDVQMPEMDGLEATRWLRSHGWKNPIIALTAHAMSGDREKCLAAGCDDYLIKTVRVQELRAIVAEHLCRAAACRS